MGRREEEGALNDTQRSLEKYPEPQQDLGNSLLCHPGDVPHVGLTHVRHMWCFYRARA